MCRTGGRRCPSSGGRGRGGSTPVSAGHVGDMSPEWAYCSCAGSHKPGCPNAGVPDGLPPLAEDDSELAGSK